MQKYDKTLLLLDAHAIIHRAYHAVPDFKNSNGIPTGALYGIINMLFGILEKFKPDYIIACYDLPHPTYRHEIYKDYKGHRKESDADLITQIKSSRKIFETLNIPIYDMPGFEADDILGTISKKIVDNFSNHKVIIASGDMDTMQLIKNDQVVVYTLRKSLTDTVVYDENAVMEKYQLTPLQLIDYKGLRGDTSDNIIGVPGIGEKTATSILKVFDNIENLYEYIDKNSFDKNNIEFKTSSITERIYKLLIEHKDSAFFSKALATIRLDAPIKQDFLKNDIWYEKVIINDFEKLLDYYELRSIKGKLNRVIEIQKGNKPLKIINDNWKKDNVNSQENIQIDDEDKIMIWLLNSNINNPSFLDICNIINNNDIKDYKIKLLQKIKENKLDFVFQNLELPIIPILKKMHKNGIKLNINTLKNLKKEYENDINDLQKRIYELAEEEFNISSPKQLGVILYDKLKIIENSGLRIKKTASGSRSTKESELEKMLNLHPIVELILEYRELTKLLTTYINVLIEKVEESEDSRIHPFYIQTGTVTGRISTENPSVQNLPIKTEKGKLIRQCFISDNNYKFVSIDYSQIELRIAALLSNEEAMLNVFNENGDIHTSVAARVYKIDENKVDQTMRRHAKAINFGILYGMGAHALQKSINITYKEAQDYILEYYATYKNLANYMQDIKNSVSKLGYTTTLFGRRRYFPEINSSLPFIKASAERMAINAPIQGTAADIMKLAMIAIDKYIVENNLDENIKMIAQIHDELLFEIKGDVEICVNEIRNIMENVLNNTKLKLNTSAKIGLNW